LRYNTAMENSSKKSGYLGHDHSLHAYFFGLITGIAVIAGLALVVFLIIWQKNLLQAKNTPAVADDVVNSQNDDKAPFEKITKIDLNSLQHVKGNVNSTDLTFIEYSDLECSFCKKYHVTVKEVAKNYQNKIAFAYKHFPLNIHSKAKREAIAAECAGLQDKFFEYVDKIFEITPSNNNLEDQKLFDTAQELNLNMDDFKACVEKEETLSTVAADALEAQGSGATGTPHAILVDKGGNILTTFQGALTAGQLTQAFDQYLAEE